MREWVEFYRLVGVERFIIWYDESDDNTLNVLKALAAKGDMRVYPVTDLPGHQPGQQPFPHAEHSFRDACLERNPDLVQWMLFLDGDEFLFPANSHNLIGKIKCVNVSQ